MRREPHFDKMKMENVKKEKEWKKKYLTDRFTVDDTFSFISCFSEGVKGGVF